jgi:hypothetical protein
VFFVYVFVFIVISPKVTEVTHVFMSARFRGSLFAENLLVPLRRSVGHLYHHDRPAYRNSCVTGTEHPAFGLSAGAAVTPHAGVDGRLVLVDSVSNTRLEEFESWHPNPLS